MSVARAKMSGSVVELRKEDMQQRLQEVIEVIDSIDLTRTLTEDGENIKQQYLEQVAGKYRVQTVLGKNYRVNYFVDDDKIELNFVFRGISHEDIEEMEKNLKELNIGAKINKKHTGFGAFTVKVNIEFEKNRDISDLVKLFTAFSIR